MPDESETTTVDEDTVDYFIASAAAWGTSPEWRALAPVATAVDADADTFTTSLDEITRGGPAFIIDRRADFIELTDTPMRRTPPRPRTWPRGKWFALSRRRRKSPQIGW